jgi:hypothetical protein
MPGKQGKPRPKASKNRGLTVLDLAFARIVNGLDCQPFSAFQGGGISTRRSGAIAQLGERVVRNDEVGGSIPPGSTSLRRLRLLRLGKPSRSEGCRVVALLGEDGL